MLSTAATGSTTTIATRTVTTDDNLRKGGGSGGSGNRAGGGGRGGRGGRGGGSGNCEGRQQSTKSSETAAAAIAVGKRCQARGEKRWRGQRQGGGPEVRVEIGAQRTLLGNNFAHIKAMRLANVYLERSQCLASRQILSVLQIDLSARADRKMVIFYVYLRYFLKKSRFHRTDTQVKTIPSVCEGKTFTHSPMRICVSVYFLK